MTPFLSIIIPAYNASKFLSDCIKSIIEQDFIDLEIIVINDGSTDCTQQICEKFSEQDIRIKTINQTNHGVSYSRNVGLASATGKYIWFVDADDTIPQSTIKLMAEALRNFSYPEIIRGEYIAIDSDGKKLFCSHFPINTHSKYIKVEPEIFFSKCIRSEFFLWLLWIRRDIINNIRFANGRIYMEDADFICQLINNIKSASYTSSIIYNYRKYDGAVSSELSFHKIKDIVSLLKNICILRNNASVKWQKCYYEKVANTSLLLIMDFLSQKGTDEKLELVKRLELTQLIQQLSISFGLSTKNEWTICKSKGYAMYFKNYRKRKFLREFKTKIRHLIEKLTNDRFNI